jgi:hypothetical protein
MSDPYEEGCKAARVGDCVDANPYSLSGNYNAEKAYRWLSGYIGESGRLRAEGEQKV